MTTPHCTEHWFYHDGCHACYEAAYVEAKRKREERRAADPSARPAHTDATATMTPLTH